MAAVSHVDADMKMLFSEIEKLLSFLHEYAFLIQSHMNDFIVRDFWNDDVTKNVVTSEKEFIVSSEEISKLGCCFHVYKSEECCVECTYKEKETCTTTDIKTTKTQLLQMDGVIQGNNKNSFLSEKKQHEVVLASSSVNAMSRILNCSKVLFIILNTITSLCLASY